MARYKLPANINELENELFQILRNHEVVQVKNENTIFALALLYLLNELIPRDRTTKHVWKRAYEIEE